MNEQIADEIRRDAKHLFNGGTLEEIELLNFYRRVVELCQDHIKVTCELAQQRAMLAEFKRVQSVVYGDLFRCAYQDGMEDQA